MNATTELGTAPIHKLLFKYAMPAIIAMTASSLYNIVDSIYIGHGCGALALGALTVAKPFMDICAAFGSLVGVGASSLLAIYLGERDYDKANKVLGNVIVLNIILSTLVMVVGLIWLDPILMAFGASEDTLGYAHEYIEIILFGNVLTHIYFGLNSMLRSAGHPRFSMVATIVAVTINVILDPIFIFGLDMGVRGAALATVLSQAVAVVWQLTKFLNKDELVRFHRGIWMLDKHITKRSLTIGLSPFLYNIAHCFVVIIINNQLKHYGGDLAIDNLVIADFISIDYVESEGRKIFDKATSFCTAQERRAMNELLKYSPIISVRYTIGWHILNEYHKYETVADNTKKSSVKEDKLPEIAPPVKNEDGETYYTNLFNRITNRVGHVDWIYSNGGWQILKFTNLSKNSNVASAEAKSHATITSLPIILRLQ